jgi:hypothetical protein
VNQTEATPAERLDRAVDALLGGQPPDLVAAGVGADAEMRPLVELAAALRRALPATPVGPRFEARVGARLAQQPLIERGVRALRHPSRLLVTGAVGSAAVGVGVTAYAVWRSSRRAGGHRLLPR